jgi:hypothetical protein
LGGLLERGGIFKGEGGGGLFIFLKNYMIIFLIKIFTLREGLLERGLI